MTENITISVGETCPGGQREDMFCTTLPNQQKVWDSTSVVALLECPEKWNNSIRLGYRKVPSPPPLWFGTMIHRGIEVMLHGICEGDPDYLKKAIRLVLEESKGYICDDTRRTRWTLVRSLIWYDLQFQASREGGDPLEIVRLHDGRPAAELSFRMPLPLESPDGDPYILAGHMDAVVRFGARLYVLEHKHTVMSLDDKYFAQYTPNPQVSLYSFAGRHIMKEPIHGVMLNGIQVGVGFNRFQRRPIPRSDRFLERWLLDLCTHIKTAETYARNNYWPQNDTSCNKFSGCTFREACSKTGETHDIWMNSKFEKVFWNPLDNR